MAYFFNAFINMTCVQLCTSIFGWLFLLTSAFAVCPHWYDTCNMIFHLWCMSILVCMDSGWYIMCDEFMACLSTSYYLAGRWFPPLLLHKEMQETTSNLCPCVHIQGKLARKLLNSRVCISPSCTDMQNSIVQWIVFQWFIACCAPGPVLLLRMYWWQKQQLLPSWNTEILIK